jgi:tryptophanyl-tRNA synthetase
LLEVLENFLGPVRIKRAEYAQDKEGVMKMLKAGCAKTEAVAAQTLKDVKEVMHLVY